MDTATPESYTLSLHDALPILTESQLLQLAASAEVYSSHVLAAAIVQTAKDQRLPILAMRDAREFATNGVQATRSEEHTSELQSRPHLVCRLLLEKKKKTTLGS